MTAKPVTLDEYMQMPWEPVFTAQPDGTVCVTVPPLKDFAIFGPREEVEREWRDALRGLLRAYIKTQKTIPLPGAFAVETRGPDIFEVQWTAPDTTPKWTFQTYESIKSL